MLDQGKGAGEQVTKASAPALLTKEGKEAADIAEAAALVGRLRVSLSANPIAWSFLNSVSAKLETRGRVALRALMSDEAAAV